MSHYKNIRLVRNNKEESQKSDIFVAAMKDGRKLALVSWKDQESLLAKFLFLQYKSISCWTDFVAFLEDIFKTTVVKDLKMRTIKNAEFVKQ